MLRHGTNELGCLVQRGPPVVDPPGQPSENQHRRRDDGGKSRVHSSARGRTVHMRLQADDAQLPAEGSNMPAEPDAGADSMGRVPSGDTGLIAFLNTWSRRSPWAHLTLDAHCAARHPWRPGPTGAAEDVR